MLALAALVVSCGDPLDDVAEDPYLDLREGLGLAPDRPIHSVMIGGRGAEEHLVPPVLEIERSDLVVFTTVDGRVHTLVFPEDSLALDVALFLERTRQLRSPPLVDRGSRFVLSFDGAPEGRYPYVSRGPGGQAWGAIIVGSEDG